MVKPITPAQIEKARKDMIPDEVIEAVNELMIDGWDSASYHTYIRQEELIELVIEKMKNTVARADLFNNHWLDIERVFVEYGWKITYDSGDPASFSFDAKKPRNDDDNDY